MAKKFKKLPVFSDFFKSSGSNITASSRRFVNVNAFEKKITVINL
jgi:hypothetical protein